MLTKLTLLERIVLPNCALNSQKLEQNVKNCIMAAIFKKESYYRATSRYNQGIFYLSKRDYSEIESTCFAHGSKGLFLSYL